MSSAPALTTDPFYTDLPVGEILRRARVQKNMTIADAELYLHIRASHLEALERSDFDSLPGSTYVVGFIRTYAEFLGLDGGRVITLLKKQTTDLGIIAQAANSPTLPTDTRLPSVPLMAVVTAAFLLLLILWVGYQGSRLKPVSAYSDLGTAALSVEAMKQLAQGDGRGADGSPASSSLRPRDSGSLASARSEASAAALKPDPGSVPTSVPEVALPPAAGQEPLRPPPIRVVMVQNSWLEIKNPEGRVVEAREFKKGEAITIMDPVDEFGNYYVVTTNNAGAVQVVMDGVTLPPLGRAGEVLRNVSLNPATLRLLREE